MTTADALLKLTCPEDLFPPDLAAAKKQFLALARTWHPDHNHGDARSAQVFAHVKALYEEAVVRIEQGRWQSAGIVSLTDRRGRTHVAPYRVSSAFELGWMYVGDDHVTYVVDAVHSDLWEVARRHLTGGFTFSSPRMEQDIGRCLPGKVEALQLDGGRFALSVPKTLDLLLLRDVARLAPEPWDRHVAWMLSALYNLACYFSHAKLVHQAIGPDTCFISPEYHSVALLGGWWYAGRVGTPVRVVPARTFAVLPWAARTTKQATPLTDLELILATGRELLGDVTGTRLDSRAPEPMLAWLMSAAHGTAVENYAAWGNVLEKSFGPKRFTKLELTADMVYPERK